MPPSFLPQARDTQYHRNNFHTACGENDPSGPVFMHPGQSHGGGGEEGAEPAPSAFALHGHAHVIRAAISVHRFVGFTGLGALDMLIFSAYN